MDKLAVVGSIAKCSMGAAPGPLGFLPVPPVMAPTPVGNQLAIIPIVNIPSFGLCTSILNPAVAAATAAAMGVLTPQPCMPVPTGPWSNPAKACIGPIPAITGASTLKCAYKGNISIIFPGQPIVEAD